MGMKIQRIEYYYAMVADQPGAAYHLLSQLAGAAVNLLAFNAIPIGPAHTQLVLFPEDPVLLVKAAEIAKLTLLGPHHAFLIRGDDELGALADLHRKLADADVNVFASSGVTDGSGGYGYVVYVRPEHYEAAAKALGL